MRLIDRIHQSFGVPGRDFEPVEKSLEVDAPEQSKNTTHHAPKQPPTGGTLDDIGSDEGEVRAIRPRPCSPGAAMSFSKSPWSSLAAYDEAVAITSRLRDLCSAYPMIGHYAASWIAAVCQAYHAGSISKLRTAYWAIIDQWLKVEGLLKYSGVLKPESEHAIKAKSKVSARSVPRPTGVAPWTGERSNDGSGAERAESVKRVENVTLFEGG